MSEVQIRNAMREAFDGSQAVREKLHRGERLSVAESRSLAEAAEKVRALSQELEMARQTRELSADAARDMYSGGESRTLVDDSPEARSFTNWLRTGEVTPELRAAGEASGSAGGFLVPPGFWQRLQVALKAYGGTANDFQPLETETGQPMQWATVDPTNVVATLIAENTQVAEQEYVFGQGVFGAYMYSSGVQLVSFQLAQDSAFDIDAFIIARVAESLGRARAAAAISGTGSNQPLGIITALNAASGLTSGGKYTLGTGNKVNVIASGSSITADTAQVTELTAGALNPASVLGVIKSVDPSYRALGAKFYMNDTQFQNHKLVADAYGQPLYKGLWNDAAPELMGYPVVVDNNIPALTASTASGVIFGHLQSAMTIRTVAGAGIMRLTERYADFLQVGYIGYNRWDMRSNDLRAATVVVAAAS